MRLSMSHTPILDHGEIELLDVMGSDAEIIQAARVSYTGQKRKRSDRALTRYLMRHWHTSPFEMAVMRFRVKAPLFVARQWVRHRTASWNEISARYTALPDDVYIPSLERMALQSTTNKQGSGDVFGDDDANNLLAAFTRNADQSVANYHELLATGLTRELARGVTTVFHYTEWVWQINLHNLLHFLRLRMDSHAQWEIRQYAEQIGQWVEEHFPDTWDAFVDYRLDAHTFSGPEMEALRKHLTGDVRENVLEDIKVGGRLSDREIAAFAAALGQ